MTAPAGPGPSLTFVSPFAQLAGSEHYLGLVLDGIPRERVRCVVFLQEGPFVEEVRRRGLHAEVIPTSARPPGLVRSALQLRRMLRTDRPDLVHANGVKAALVCVLATIRTRTPVVWVKHDLSFDRSLARPLARRCRLVVGVSEAAVRVFTGPIRQRVRVVPNAIETSSIDRTAARRLVLERLGAPQDAQVIGLVGRLYTMKGQHELLEVLPELRHRSPRVRVAFAGQEDPAESAYASELRRRAAELGLDKVLSFLGRVEDGAQFAAGCDVVAVPSVPAERGNTESFSFAALEAMAAGTPVVGYAEGGIPETVGDCGLLVPTGDRTAFLEALVRVLEDDDLRLRLARCGRERAEREFSLERMRTGIERCYREALAG